MGLERLIIEQNKFLKGRQRFELISKEATLECMFKRFSTTNQFRVPLSAINKDAIHMRRLSIQWYVIAGIFAVVGVLFLSAMRNAKSPEAMGAVIAPSIVFFVAAIACFIQAMKFSVNTLTFFGKYNNQPLFGIWYNKPNKQEFDAFVGELRNQIILAEQSLPMAALSGSVVDEIAKLKLLLDKGALTQAEFEKMKTQLIESGQSKRIGFAQ